MDMAGRMPSIDQLPSPGTPAPNAVAPGSAAATDMAGRMQSIDQLPSPGTPPAEQSFWDKTKDFYNKNISPSGIQAQGEAAAQEAGNKAVEALRTRIPGATPAMQEAAYQSAYKAAMPGMFATYGPMAGAGIAALGLTGGFQSKPVTASPYDQYMTSKLAKERQMLADNPNLYALTGFPAPIRGYGGKVYTGAPTTTPAAPIPLPAIPGIPPVSSIPGGYADGGIAAPNLPFFAPPPSAGGYADGGEIAFPEAQARYWNQRNAAVLAGQDVSKMGPAPQYGAMP
ncbi:hypothetical protein EBR96_10730, partial [bacterium]|nr:hypothetical protein [bacterium]